VVDVDKTPLGRRQLPSTPRNIKSISVGLSDALDVFRTSAHFFLPGLGFHQFGITEPTPFNGVWQFRLKRLIIVRQFEFDSGSLITERPSAIPKIVKHRPLIRPTPITLNYRPSFFHLFFPLFGLGTAFSRRWMESYFLVVSQSQAGGCSGESRQVDSSISLSTAFVVMVNPARAI
jgi:hypothetical protein